MTAEGDLAILDETKATLGGRVARLDTGMAWAEDPPSRTRHLITNIEVEPGDTLPATAPCFARGIAAGAPGIGFPPEDLVGAEPVAAALQRRPVRSRLKHGLAKTCGESRRTLT